MFHYTLQKQTKNAVITIIADTSSQCPEFCFSFSFFFQTIMSQIIYSIVLFHKSALLTAAIGRLIFQIKEKADSEVFLFSHLKIRKNDEGEVYKQSLLLHQCGIGVEVFRLRLYSVPSEAFYVNIKQSCNTEISAYDHI